MVVDTFDSTVSVHLSAFVSTTTSSIRVWTMRTATGDAASLPPFIERTGSAGLQHGTTGHTGMTNVEQP